MEGAGPKRDAISRWHERLGQRLCEVVARRMIEARCFRLRLHLQCATTGAFLGAVEAIREIFCRSLRTIGFLASRRGFSCSLRTRTWCRCGAGAFRALCALVVKLAGSLVVWPRSANAGVGARVRVVSLDTGQYSGIQRQMCWLEVIETFASRHALIDLNKTKRWRRSRL